MSRGTHWQEQFIAKSFQVSVALFCISRMACTSSLSLVVVKSAPSNYVSKRTGRFLRFSGHPELTFRSRSHGQAWPSHHPALQP